MEKTLLRQVYDGDIDPLPQFNAISKKSMQADKQSQKFKKLLNNEQLKAFHTLQTEQIILKDSFGYDCFVLWFYSWFKDIDGGLING